MRAFFVFDVESIGLHGEGFAVAGGVYLENGAAQFEFRFACDENLCKGDIEDRKWVAEHVPVMTMTHREPHLMRTAFWEEWMKAKLTHKAIMAADCLWPVEARFVAACIDDKPIRAHDGPYPFIEISSVLLASGMDPLGEFERLPSELPKHDPLADARQSARMLATALKKHP